MVYFFQKIARFCGVDRAVAYTLTSRGWQILAGVCTICFVAHFLSPIQQGFYYTFASILALQIFFELGLTYVIMQFASHEKAHLVWTTQRTIEGDPIAKSRLGSLMRLAVRWYGVAAFILVIFLMPAGLFFFGRSPDAAAGGNWQIPWLWLVLSTAGTLLISPIFAILEGSGLVADVARYRTMQDFTAYIIFWLGLYSGLGLFAVPLLQTIRVLISALWLFWFYRVFIRTTFQFKIDNVKFKWWTEVWPMQWKIALSSMSGFFVFYLFNPILFIYFGAVEAGKMGMSLSVAGALSVVSMAWVNTKIPIFGQLIALKKYSELDRLFFQVLKQAFIISLIGAAILFTGLVILQNLHIPLSGRLLGLLPFSFLLGVSVVNVIIFSEAAYLRAHKDEPFLLNSLVGAVITTLICYFLGRSYGALGMSSAYFALTATLGLSWGTWIFAKKRSIWHSL